ncbi:MAG: hypothetical protein ACRDD9_23980, partial [Shewanella sp.]
QCARRAHWVNRSLSAYSSESFCRAEALCWQTPIAMIRYVIKLLLNCDSDILAAKLSWAHGPDNGKEREY